MKRRLYQLVAIAMAAMITQTSVLPQRSPELFAKGRLSLARLLSDLHFDPLHRTPWIVVFVLDFNRLARLEVGESPLLIG